jgi:hypothetical protein
MTEEKAAPSKLHWPAWIWVIGNFLVAGYYIFGLILMLIDKVLIDPGVSIAQIYFINIVNTILLLASAISIIVNRKVGWFVAIATILIIGFAESIITYWGMSLQEVLDKIASEPKVYVVVLIGFYVANAVWLIYFILARRRYLSLRSEDEGYE